MAIVQISKIQIRRGLNQDLPQLDAAEMGWSTDTQQLYIGNGLTSAPDYAPTVGYTEILTEHSNILGLVGTYTYKGDAGGYTVQTGVNSSNPVVRSLQQKLDDMVDVRDFGAAGDGVTDDTGAINRAIQQLYSSIYLDTAAQVRRALNFPAGTYVVSKTILVPPYAKFVGDGRDSSIIFSSNGAAPIFQTVDSQYNGTGSTKPRDVLIQDMQLQSSATAGSLTSALLQVDSCSNGTFVNVKFMGNIGATNNLVYITDSISNTRTITFDNCTFVNGASGVNVYSYGSGIASVRINNSDFENFTVSGYSIGANINGFSSSHNFIGNVATPRITNNNPTHYVFGDAMYGTGAGNVAGVTIGRLTTSGTVSTSIPTGTATVLGQLTNGAGSLDYQLDNGSAYRVGKIKFTVTGAATTFEDDYTVTGTTLGGNLFINGAGYLSCSVTTAATLKYNLTQYF
jgi:Pectate lyase superfamily protein/Major tropism determinant N-terminal domain